MAVLKRKKRRDRGGERFRSLGDNGRAKIAAGDCGQIPAQDRHHRSVTIDVAVPDSLRETIDRNAPALAPPGTGRDQATPHVQPASAWAELGCYRTRKSVVL